MKKTENNKSKICKSLTAVIISCILMLTPLQAYGAEEGLVPVDAVLVLDVSYSMRTADPSRISRDAMNLFIGMLEEGRDRVGVVAYAGQVVRSRAMTTIRSAADRESFREFIDGLNYASWTDHGLGLLEAIRIMYDSHESTRQPIIIILTDGNLSINPRGTRTIAEAEYDVELALRLAQELGYPIYSIGLNFDGTLDREYVENLAKATGGLSFETANAEDLPGIMNAIFNVMISKPPPEPIIPIIYEPEIYEPPTYEYTPYEPPQEPPASPPEDSPPPEDYKPEAPPEESQERVWILIAALAIVLLFMIWAGRRGGKRVFTGRLMIEADTPQYRNLIEYGHSTTLHNLLGKEINPKATPQLESILLTPSPIAPSHLPQLLIKCKNPHIRFTKDFLEQDASRGFEINTGSEISITLEGIPQPIRIKYII